MFCVICEKEFFTNYKKRKTCSSECSHILHEQGKRVGRIERTKIWREENPEKYKEQVKRHTKNRQDSGKATITNRLYREANRDKIRQRTRQWYANNPLKKKSLNHKRRMNEIKIGGDQKEMQKRLEMFNECIYCGSQHNLTVEHLVPISKGGTNINNNLYMACGKCNSSKHTHDFLSWYRSQTFYDFNKEYDILLLSLAG